MGHANALDLLSPLKAPAAPATLYGLARELQQAQAWPVTDASIAQKLA